MLLLPDALLGAALLPLTLASPPSTALDDPPPPTFSRRPGLCAMRDSCGRKSAFGGEIPCPDNGEATSHEGDAVYLATLAQVCGEDFESTTCCTQGQLETLQASLAQAEPLIASCLACRTNFRRFYCHFTCSPSQSTFLTISQTQTLADRDGNEHEAVKEVEFAVSEEFGSGFFESCREVKFGATNGRAIDLMGGGATDYLSFLRYMGQERALGSPFQINFPSPSSLTLSSSTLSASSLPHANANSSLALSFPLPTDPATPLSLPPIPCSSPLDPSLRCACPDCPSICASLPPVLPPAERDRPRCRVGRMDCFPFVLVVVYAVALVVGTAGMVVREARTKWTRGGGGKGAIRLGEDEDEDGEGAGGDEEGALGVSLGTWKNLRHRLSFGAWGAAAASRPAAVGTGGEGGAAASPLLFADDSDGSEADELDLRRTVTRPGAGAGVSPARGGAGAGGRSRSGTGSGSASGSSGRGLGLVGARAAASELDGGSGSGSARRPRGDSNADSSSGPSFSHSSRSHGASLSLADSHHSHSNTYGFDPSAAQPRTYALNTHLSSFFHRLGLFCASRPYAVLALGLALCGVAHLGWGRFEVETDPVRLWVPEGSEVLRQKERFEGAFGPFYRTEQVFFSVAPPRRALSDDEAREGDTLAGVQEWVDVDAPVLTSFSTLEFLQSLESDIRALRSTLSNLSLTDVCFAPTASSPSGRASEPGECVVQSLLGYFGNDLDAAGVTAENWAERVDACAASPAGCLPPFGQPINPKLVLSSPASSSSGEGGRAGAPHDAKAVILTYVLSSSLDPVLTSRAEEWEHALASYLRALSAPSGPAAQRGIRVSYSVGTSLEEELSAAANTDVPVVVASYLLMFAYVALALGGSASAVLRVLVRLGAVVAGAVGRAVGRVGRKVRARVWGQAVKLGEEGEEERNAGGRVRSASFLTGGKGLGLGAYLRRQVFVESKFSLGLVGILIVLLSVSTSVAICSAAGVKVTLVIAEVIPFLVLAIGVDNVFLLVHTLSVQNARAYASSARHATSSTGGISGGGAALDPVSDLDDDDDLPPPEERLARTLARMGPSILLSASCEAVAFGLGALVGMPAVRNFAIYAAGAVMVNSVLQVTVFVAVLALDLRRTEAGRVDCFPCISLPSTSTTSGHAPSLRREGVLARFIRTTYAPNLLRKPVKFLVVALFSGLFVLSWIGARHVELGLDQRLALPSTSHLIPYFTAVDTYLDVGPPVYFVAEGINLTSLAGVEHVCGRFGACDEYSLANVLEAERKRPESSFLAEPPAVWLDDFIQWTNPLLEDCCRVKRRNPNEFCGPNDSEFACKPCFEDREPPWSTTLEGFPEGGEFMRYLRHWLASPTDEACPLGGKAAYGSALSLSNATHDDEGTVELSHFRTYHTPLKTQSDFIEAFAAAQRISEDLSRRTGAKVFPYSLPYVFFQSYGTIWSTTREVLAFALLAIFLVTSFLLGSLRTAAAVTLTTFLSLFSVLGVMGAWRIPLNPLSLVNLCVSTGLAVEFSAHLARAFMGTRGGVGVPPRHPAAARDRDDRAIAALEDVGASVVSGILATKAIGIAVLFLTKSALLKTFYARMLGAVVASSALHGLVFLPVALSFFGGQGYALSAEDADGDWITTSVQRRYERENLFYNDDDASSIESE
ncbi:hypothetical protein JCM6882_005641 [Rhodosporidiobolus microsporus]